MNWDNFVDKSFESLWQWGKWNGISVSIFLILWALQVAFGSFVRWEVGPIPEPAAAEFPYDGLSRGWSSVYFFDQGPRKV